MRLIALILLPSLVLAQIPFRPDFPAVGVPGANVTGGRSATATNYVIDTIQANRAAPAWSEAVPGGTYPGYTRCDMRYFIEQATSPKNGIIAVAGYEIYPYNDNPVFSTPNWTLSGQTAPGRYVIRNNGITLDFRSDNFIMEHITFMIGDSVQSVGGGGKRSFNNEAHALSIVVSQAATTDLVGGAVSHCTWLYGIDSNVDVFNSNPDLRKIDSLLFWRNLGAAAIDIPSNAEAVAYGYPDDPDLPNDGYSDEVKDNHSYNFSIGLSYQSTDAVDVNKANKNIVLIENVLAHYDARGPLSNSNMTLANNVIFNSDNRGTYLRNEGPEQTPDVEDAPPTTTNIIGNYYKAGPVTGGGLSMQPVYFGEGFNSVPDPTDDDTLVSGSQVFLSGNLDDWSRPDFYIDAVESRTPHVFGSTRNGWTDWGLQLMGAEHLVSYLVPRVGATSQYRTLNETKILNDVTSGEMSYSSEPLTVTLIKSLTNTNMPNGGGFPSITYTKRTFTDLPATPNGDSDADGYSNLEEYIFDNYTLKAEFQGRTILHGSWEFERYPWMGWTFTQLEKRMAYR